MSKKPEKRQQVVSDRIEDIKDGVKEKAKMPDGTHAGEGIFAGHAMSDSPVTVGVSEAQKGKQ